MPVRKTSLVRESWSGVSGVSGVVSDAESGGRQEHQGILAEVHQQHSAESDHRGHRESIIAEQHRGQAGHTGRSSSKALRPQAKGSQAAVKALRPASVHQH